MLSISRFIVLLLVTSPTFAGSTRLLFSHFAPGQEPMTLSGNGAMISQPLAYSETASRYQLVEGGPVSLSVFADDQLVLTRDVTMGPGDYSVFFHLDTNGDPALSVTRDTLAAFDFPAPFDFETGDANAAGRFLSFAALPPESDLTLLGTASQFFNTSDGVVAGGEFQSAFDVSSGAAVGGDFPATVNTDVYFTVRIEVGTDDAGGDGLGEITLAQAFDMTPGTTDYVLIGTEETLEIIDRPRPGARSALIDGIYGEAGINGSGVQLYELQDIGRVFGFLYTYGEDGNPTWYYLDSRCDLDRGFQCTTPGFIVATGSYIVAVYQTSNGAFASGMDADIDIVGTGRVRVPRQNVVSPGFVEEDGAAPSANVALYLTPPELGQPPFVSEPDAEFEFGLIRR